MRVKSAIVLLGLAWPELCAAGPCEVAAPPEPLNRNAIESGAVLFGANDRSVYKLRLGVSAPESIAAHGGLVPASLSLSPSKRWLLYRTEEPESYFYDTRTAREHPAGIRSDIPADIRFSPDETRAAWIERGGGAYRLAVFEFGRFAARRISLPAAPDPKAVFFDLQWTEGGDSLVYAWRGADRQEFFRADLRAGTALPIAPRREFGADEFVETSYLLGKPFDPGGAPPFLPGTDKLSFREGSVRRMGGAIVLEMPDEPARAIAAASESCGEPVLLALFGGRYVLYRTGPVYWIYGIAEDRRAILYRGQDRLVW